MIYGLAALILLGIFILFVFDNNSTIVGVIQEKYQNDDGVWFIKVNGLIYVCNPTVRYLYKVGEPIEFECDEIEIDGKIYKHINRVL